MSSRAALRPALLLPGALAAGIVFACAAAAQETPAERITRILDHGGFQRELPGAPEPAETAPPPRQRSEPLADDAAAVSASPPDLSWVSALLWTLGVAAVAVVLLVLVARLRGGRPSAADAGAETRPGTMDRRGGGTPVVVTDADRLAAQGAWAEAIHALLLHGLDGLKRRAGLALPPALTSRELLRRLSLPDRAATALAAMVEAVERSHFGGRPVGPDDYRACREHHRALLDHARSGAE